MWHDDFFQMDFKSKFLSFESLFFGDFDQNSSPNISQNIYVFFQWFFFFFYAIQSRIQ
jgi:hypothetical protein